MDYLPIKAAEIVIFKAGQGAESTGFSTSAMDGFCLSISQMGSDYRRQNWENACRNLAGTLHRISCCDYTNENRCPQ